MVHKLEEGWKGANNEFFSTPDEAIDSINKLRNHFYEAVDKLPDEGIQEVAPNLVPIDAKVAVKDAVRSLFEQGYTNTSDVIANLKVELVNYGPEFIDFIAQYLQSII